MSRKLRPIPNDLVSERDPPSRSTPPGTVLAASATPLRFAILEHRRDGVHWDFLVEDGPALRAWAIDAPIVAEVDLPARELPPHRRIYLDYEGQISGGRGSVHRWDGGECVATGWGERAVRLEVRGAQLVGTVELRSVGDEDRRSWVFRFGKLS
jgi:hypothetical protein